MMRVYILYLTVKNLSSCTLERGLLPLLDTTGKLLLEFHPCNNDHNVTFAAAGGVGSLFNGTSWFNTGCWLSWGTGIELFSCWEAWLLRGVVLFENNIGIDISI